MKQSSQKQKKKDKSWIFLVLFLIGLGLLFFTDGGGGVSKPKPGQLANNPEHIKKVDSYLKGTAYDLEAQKRQGKLDLYNQMGQFRNSKPQEKYSDGSQFSLESDPNMSSLTQDLNRSQQALPDQTPEEIVQNRLYENQQLQKASEEYRQAYAEAFIENARRGGWEVELGPNFEVLSVKKIKQPRHPSLFEDTDGGGSR